MNFRLTTLFAIILCHHVCFAQTFNPVPLTGITDGTGGASITSASSICISGNYAYLVSPSGNNTLEIIDISNPLSPVHKSKLANGTSGTIINAPTSIFVSGNYAYIVNRLGHSLEIVDVSNPAAPVHKGNLADGAGGASLYYPFQVFVSGNYAYVTSEGDNALEIIDVSIPTTPVHKALLSNGVGGAKLTGDFGMFLSGNYVYVCSVGSGAQSISAGFQIVDISTAGTPVPKGNLTAGVGGALLGNPTAVAVRNGYAYIMNNGTNMLEVVDVSDPLTPTPKASLADGTNGAHMSDINSIAFSGNYALLTVQNGIEIIDISDPTAPVHHSFISTGTEGALLQGKANSIAISGNFAYVTSSGSATTFTGALQVISLFAPEAPVAVAASAVTSGSFTANWNAATATNGYYLDVSTSSIFDSFVSGYQNLSVGNVTSYNVTNLLAGTTYYYRVRISDATYGTSASSNIVSSLSVLAAPAILLTDNITESHFDFHWDASATASGYYLDVSTSNTFSSFVTGYQNLSVGNITSYEVTNLVAGVTYYYRLRAANSASTSANSDVGAVSLPFLIPQASDATNITATGFTAHWGNAIGASGYQFDLSIDNFNTFVSGFNSTSVAGTSQVITGLTPGTTYQYRVRASNSIAVTGNSATIVVATIKSDQSITFGPINDLTLGDPPFTLMGTSSSGLAVNYATSSGKITLSGNAATIVGAGRDTITAAQPGNSSYNPAPQLKRGFCINPAQPTITISIIGTKVTLTSSAYSGNQWFLNETAIRGSSGTALETSVNGSYSVQAATTDGCLSLMSANTIISITGEIIVSEPISFFPNPVRDYIFIQGMKEQVFECALADILGNAMVIKFDQEGNSLKCDVRNLAVGIYILTVITGNSVNQVRFVKQ